MTIPLSLIGQMIEYSQTSSVSYWIGAGIVFLSFVFINHESNQDEEPRKSELPSMNGSQATGNGIIGEPKSFLAKIWNRVRLRRQ